MANRPPPPVSGNALYAPRYPVTLTSLAPCTASPFPPQGKQPVLPVDDYAWVAKYQHVAPGMLPYTPPVFRATPYAVDLNQPNMYFGTAVIKE